jgi:DNA-binding NtrC family response regulator
MRQGAFAFLLKPFSPDQLAVTLQKAEDHLRLLRVNAHFSRGEESDLLGQSLAMDQLRRVVRAAARTQATVLVRGESGTGKELVARVLHRQSPRAAGPFVKVDCARIPRQDQEGELFGREGATSAVAPARRTGRLELAQGGTLLLDEIGTLSSEVQGRLVRLLQEREFARVEGHRPIKADVRLIATSNRPLEEQVQRGKFRQDLFLALNLVPITVPPLRERKEDIAVLTEHFRERYARRHGVEALAVSSASMIMLQDYAWPGNVRELQGMIERAVILCREGGILEQRHLSLASAAVVPEADAVTDAGVPKLDTLAEVEKAHILAVLEKYRGNRTHAAAALGISIRTLRNKLREYRAKATAPSAGAETATG